METPTSHRIPGGKAVQRKEEALINQQVTEHDARTLIPGEVGELALRQLLVMLLPTTNLSLAEFVTPTS
ncbi:hypothetical protein WMY93_003365 [Mugilogobius chulae]|uniref:Uncharacterized protein n=1 Tax=Mugilogobius chulae TaxID=88201 RepID=A0AAW0PZC7_9GOBI